MINNLLNKRKYNKWAKQSKEKKETFKECLKGLNLLSEMDINKLDTLSYQTIYLPSYVLTLYDLINTLENVYTATKLGDRPMKLEYRELSEMRLDRWLEFDGGIDIEDVITVLVEKLSKLNSLRETSDEQSYIDRKCNFCLVVCSLFIEVIGEKINEQ